MGFPLKCNVKVRDLNEAVLLVEIRRIRDIQVAVGWDKTADYDTCN